ncbi:hypothetical protein TNCT_513031 [Trichonephila clavata]|uniref:Secreted protein n=1 Tax=Trichonephila clavata TaxID=2740835 RepID=A0A8X6GH77_TRICU|nr:hypothetical protein TNCT_513031 [Trichonephila clavata]
MLPFTIYILLLPAAGRDVVVCFPETKSGWLGHQAKFECRAVKTPHLTGNALAWYCKYAASTECGLGVKNVRIRCFSFRARVHPDVFYFPLLHILFDLYYFPKFLQVVRSANPPQI